MNCKTCGAYISDDMKYCGYCGAANTRQYVAPTHYEDDIYQDESNNMKGENGKSGMRVFMTLLLIIGIIGCAAFGALFAIDNGIIGGGETAKGFVEDVAKAASEMDARIVLDAIPQQYIVHIKEKNELDNEQLRQAIIDDYLDKLFNNYDSYEIVGTAGVSERRIKFITETVQGISGVKLTGIESPTDVIMAFTNGGDESDIYANVITGKIDGEWVILDCVFTEAEQESSMLSAMR